MDVKRQNVILITVDSLRADHLGCYGYHKPTSPNIDRLANQSSLFLSAFSDGPNTPHAFPAILASQHSLQSKKLGLFDAPRTLAEILREAGYITVGANAANPYVSKLFHYDRGFDEFFDYLDSLVAAKKHERPDSGSSHICIPQFDLEQYLVSEKSIRNKAWLEAEMNADIFNTIRRIARERFFLWLHYMDPHYPYLPQLQPQLDLGRKSISKEENRILNIRVRENMPLSPDLLNQVVFLYDAAIRQLDTKIGELFIFLKKNQLYDSSLIFFAADHGEEFQDHGDLQHKSKLFDELIRVPLIIKTCNQQNPELHRELVSLMQIAPTIAGRAKIDHPFCVPAIDARIDSNVDANLPHIFSGASYGANGGTPTDRMFNTPILPKIFCLRDRQWKLIMDVGKKQNLLFNILEDPRESKNVHDRAPQIASRLAKLLETQVAKLEKDRIRAQISRVRSKMRLMSGEHLNPMQQISE